MSGSLERSSPDMRNSVSSYSIEVMRLLSVTQWAAMESYEAEKRPVRRWLRAEIHGLEELECCLVDIGLYVTDPEDVGGRVLPRLPRRPPSEADPALQLAHVVAQHTDGSPHLAPRRVSPRESIQITAGRKGVPSTSTATVPDHCAVHPTPTMLDAVTEDSASARRAAAAMAPHHAAGSCSAPPPGKRCNSTGSAHARRDPSRG